MMRFLGQVFEVLSVMDEVRCVGLGIVLLCKLMAAFQVALRSARRLIDSNLALFYEQLLVFTILDECTVGFMESS